MLRAFMIALAFAGPVHAETLVAARTVRAQTILTDADLAVVKRVIPGMLQSVSDAVGQEARVSLYAGRPIRPDDIGPPAIIDRNQVVTLLYKRGSLTIAADARSLGRAGVGDLIRVMNLSSRSTVSGIVQSNGSVVVGGPDLSALN